MTFGDARWSGDCVRRPARCPRRPPAGLPRVPPDHDRDGLCRHGHLRPALRHPGAPAGVLHRLPRLPHPGHAVDVPDDGRARGRAARRRACVRGARPDPDDRRRGVARQPGGPAVPVRLVVARPAGAALRPGRGARGAAGRRHGVPARGACTPPPRPVPPGSTSAAPRSAAWSAACSPLR
ncbi:hypothetical protein [Nocardioides convexus]|uniref:hypothetical protein n=1 Tax=Nocardioides convexus TaxID=2712224 RepID=UPI002418B1F5|nr:hypothetical protein [Nocardioides convexus]